MKHLPLAPQSASQTPGAKSSFPIRAHLVILGAYFLLTIGMTWPAALHLTEAIPGDGFDGWQNYWNLWWVKQALLVKQTTPYFTPYLDAPLGASLLFHTLNIFNGLWTLPIQLTFDLVLAYNSVVFFSFVFAGYGAYLLSLYTLTWLSPTTPGLRPAAFVGGLVFTMSPFHFAHLLGHMQVFSMVWPPFYALWLLRTIHPRVTPGHTFSRSYPWRSLALSTLFLILASLVDWYHTLYLLIFTGLVWVWALRQRWQIASATKLKLTYLLQPLWGLLLIGLGFIIFLSPLLLPMLRDASHRTDLETGLSQNVTLSADLLAFVTPSEMHPLWRDWARKLADNFSSTTSERLIFAGFVPLALALFVIIRRWSNPVIKFWTTTILIFLLLALGPYLHIGGQIVAIGDWPMPMPYLLLYHIVPFLDLTRSLSRYDLMIMLGLGVLVAAALKQLIMSNEQLSKPEAHTTFYVLRFMFYVLPLAPSLIPLIAAALICVEFLPVPYPISKIDTPQFYFDIAAQSEDFTIAELPMNWDRPTPLLHQTTHGKRLLTAYTSRDNPLELAWRTPVFQHWKNLGPDILDQPLKQIAPTIFYDFNLRYIVLDYWQMPPGPERDQTEQWVASALPDDLAPIYDDGRLKVYHSPSKAETTPYLSLGDGWGQRVEDQKGFISRTFPIASNQPAELFIHHPQNQSLLLTITAATPQETTTTVVISTEGQPIDEFQVTSTFSTYTIALPLFTKDIVKLSFQAQQDNPVIIRRISLNPKSNL